MVLMLIALIVMTTIPVSVIWHCKLTCSENGVSYAFANTALVICFVPLFIYSLYIPQYIGAEYKADVLNKKYGTNYTREDVFYASDVIEKIIRMDKAE